LGSYETTLTKLAIADDSYYEALLAGERSNVSESHLEPKTHALVRLGALIALDTTSPGYMWTVESARRNGASEDEIVGCLIAALPAVGVASVVGAATKLALALGYDVTAALEERGLVELEPDEEPAASPSAWARRKGPPPFPDVPEDPRPPGRERP
jgi:alkylhydroperoxidase/carboxymuconolactone decarboxylase family protein YurZ